MQDGKDHIYVNQVIVKEFDEWYNACTEKQSRGEPFDEYLVDPVIFNLRMMIVDDYDSILEMDNSK